MALIMNMNLDKILLQTSNLEKYLENLSNFDRNIVLNKLYLLFKDTYNNMFYFTILEYLLIYEIKSLEPILILYKDNININIKNTYGLTFLSYIIIYRDIHILKIILNLYPNININILDNCGANILSLLINSFILEPLRTDNRRVFNGEVIIEIVKLLLKKGVKIQYQLLKYMLLYGICNEKNVDIFNKYGLVRNKYDKKQNDQIMEIFKIILDYKDEYLIDELYNEMYKELPINYEMYKIYEIMFSCISSSKSASKINN